MVQLAFSSLLLQAELSKHEETVYRERREREEGLAVLKKQAEEKKAHAERVERRVSREEEKPPQGEIEIIVVNFFFQKQGPKWCVRGLVK